MADHKVPSTATEEGLMGLPVGFRFHPTDEEIVVHYLLPKAMNSNFSTVVIGQADFNKCEPWELPRIANMGDSERFYYYQRDRKYPTGLRTNRATGAGYWKATGKDKEIYKLMELVGMKKTLVFYTGRAPRGMKTNWVMHEYRLHPQQFTLIPKNDEWVVSRVFNKNASDGMHNRPYSGNGSFSAFLRSESFCIDELIKDDFESLPPLVDPSAPPKVTHVQDLKPEAVMPISHGFSHMWHPNSSIESYNDDQLIYTHNHNPVDFYPYTFFQSPDIQLKYKKNGGGCTMEEYKCNKVVQQCASSKDKELSFNNFEMLSNDQDEDHDLRQSTLGSMPDLSNLWDY